MDRAIKRTNNTVLPDSTELSKILETEVVRPIPASKIGIHYPLFETAIAIFDHYQIKTSLFTNDSLNIHEAVTEARLMLDDIVKSIYSRSISEKEIHLFNAAYDYLSEEDSPKKSDLIFTFGARTSTRAEKALELYKTGYANKIMASGGSPIYAQVEDFPEALKYKEIFLAGGISKDKILIEDKSITMPDNVRRSLNLLDELKEPYQSIILVNSPYSQRRGWAIFRKHLPDSVALYRVNSSTSETYSKENWYKQENTLRIVLNEFLKMRASVVYDTA